MQNIVAMKHIYKDFPGVRALDDVSFELRSGEVMALLGENGAGKSTLIKILSGVYDSDRGTIEIFGKTLESLNPRIAEEQGVAIIHQELNMCPHLSVTENIFLMKEHVGPLGILKNQSMKQATQKILQELQIDIDPDTPVGKLPVSKQQMIEIAKALSSNAKILIMDEPTSALSNKEIYNLFMIIRKLKSQGCGIVYISHRLEELQHIVDRVTIMRDGKFIVRDDFKKFTMEQIISHMVGRNITEQFPRTPSNPGKTIFEVRSFNAGKMVKDIAFSVREGEILGIAGLMGAGRTETTRAIFGIDPKESGEFYLNGKQIAITSPADAIRQGIVLAPEDRKNHGLCVKLSVRENIALPNLDKLCNPFGVVNRRKEAEMVASTQKNFFVKMASAEAPVASLSGGNQQKIVVGKWLARQNRVVIFDEPTRGIDVAAKIEIYNLMNSLKAWGIGVLFVSSELAEIMGIADRILVMCNGRITGECMPEDSTQETIMELATQFDMKIAKAQ